MRCLLINTLRKSSSITFNFLNMGTGPLCQHYVSYIPRLSISDCCLPASFLGLPTDQKHIIWKWEVKRMFQRRKKGTCKPWKRSAWKLYTTNQQSIHMPLVLQPPGLPAQVCNHGTDLPADTSAVVTSIHFHYVRSDPQQCRDRRRL